MRRRLVTGTAETHGHARADVVTESDRPDKMRPADGVLFTGSKSGGNRGNAGMRARRAMRVVGFVRMRENSVRERGLNRTADNLGGHNCGDLLSAIRASKFERCSTRR